MYNPDWQEIDPEDVPAMVAAINRELKERPFDATMTIGKRQSVSFYAEHDLMEFVDTSTSNPTYTRRVLYGPDGFQVMNWSNGPIYTANEKAPINVNEDNAAEYVKFFFNYVKGRHGRFVIVEDVSEIAWEGDIPAKGKEAVAKIIKPVAVTTVEDGKINLLAFMVFKDSLFRANVHVERDGMVSLSDEALVIEGMPIVEDVVPDEG
jgi:hypothetical protein